MAHDVSIIGGGPGGLMAAEILSAAGCAVTVYERKPTVARKFLMAGRGGLNLTHSEPLTDFMHRYGSAAEWLKPYIDAFTPTDLRNWCDALEGETFIGSSGRVFPKAMKASPLLRNWVNRLTAQGVQFKMQHEWQGWDAEGALQFNPDIKVKPGATLLSLGGASWPRLGSDAGWIPHLEQRGVAIAPFKPANCGFVCAWSELFSSRYAGQPLKPVALSHEGKTIRGEVMITQQGVEGGGIYAISRQLREAIERDGQTTLQLDLRPGLTLEELTHRLSKPRGSQSFSTYLRKVAELSPVAASLLRETAQDLTALQPTALAKLIKAFPLTLTAPAAIDRAISSAGGIQLDQIDGHLQLKALPGVYVAGEMLDWEAPTGGYLLQATFSTAVAAAKGILAAMRPGAF